MNAFALVSQLGGRLLAIALAPVVGGLGRAMPRLAAEPLGPVACCSPIAVLRKLFRKDAALATHASPLFRAAPYVVFGTMAMAAAIIPSVTTDLPMARVADAIALVGLFATGRVFIALAAMDIGTVFGSMGARREMMIGFLAEPALLMVLFNAFLMFGSTALPTRGGRHRSMPAVWCCIRAWLSPAWLS